MRLATITGATFVASLSNGFGVKVKVSCTVITYCVVSVTCFSLMFDLGYRMKIDSSVLVSITKNPYPHFKAFP